jgi:hypothetical protein
MVYFELRYSLYSLLCENGKYLKFYAVEAGT